MSLKNIILNAGKRITLNNRFFIIPLAFLFVLGSCVSPSLPPTDEPSAPVAPKESVVIRKKQGFLSDEEKNMQYKFLMESIVALEQRFLLSSKNCKDVMDLYAKFNNLSVGKEGYRVPFVSLALAICQTESFPLYDAASNINQANFLLLNIDTFLQKNTNPVISRPYLYGYHSYLNNRLGDYRKVNE
jgi:hypothetical protein